MKQHYTKLALLVLLILSMTIPSNLFGGVDEEEMKEKLPLMMGQSNVGRDFWFSIPPCYEVESGGYDNFIKVLVAAPVEALVNIEVPGKGYNKTIKTKPNSVVEFLVKPATASAISHQGNTQVPPPTQVYRGAGVHVWSDVPLVIYVIVKYKYTTDGFLAIPSSAYGTRYINMAYQEPDITSGLMTPFTAVTTPYDQTNVTFTMGGGPEFDNYVPLDGGRKVRTGESATANMDRGDVWLLAIGGHRQDLSGSVFEANKPFSIVSGVHCANFPLGVYACDYTVEMELPTYTWGKQYFVTPMMDRCFNGIIRIFAAEDDTKVYRDSAYMGTIKKGGGAPFGVGYFETRVWKQYDDNGKPFRPKLATISADKPIQIMYYNTGVTEDSGPNACGFNVDSDPFQMILTPIEQFNTEMYFASPNALGGSDPFTRNYVNLVFELKQDFMPKDLMYADMPKNGAEPVWIPVSDRFGGGFQKFTVGWKGVDYAYTTLQLPTEGVYGIKSDSTKFVAYSYGFATFESYGFPTAAALRDLTSPDTNAPVPTYVQECNGDVLKDMGTVTDMPDDDGVRSNMADIYLIENLGDNYEFGFRTNLNEEQFIPGVFRTLSWWLTVKDKKLPARATIYFVDRAGNDTTITVEYNPPEYEVVSGHSLPSMKPNDPKVMVQDTIRNLSANSPLYVTRVELQKGNQGFMIESFEPAGWAPGMPIAIGEEVLVNISFDPAVALASGEKPIYIDSLGIGYGDQNFVECGFAYEVQEDGRLGVPIVKVTDKTWTDININDPNAQKANIEIRNESTESLKVYGIASDLTLGEFTHNFNQLYPNVSMANPLIIPANENKTFEVTFKPTAAGVTYRDSIVFDTDAETIDEVCMLIGNGIDSDVSTGDYPWGKVLIHRPPNFPAGPYTVDGTNSHKGLYIENTGNAGIPVTITDVVVTPTPAEAINYFRIAGGKTLLEYANQDLRGLALTQKIDEEVTYQPTTIGDHTVEVEITFNIGGRVENRTLVYKGTGLVPRIKVEDVTYTTPMLVDDEANAQSGLSMRIINESYDYEYDLTVTGINVNASSDISNFQGKAFRYDGNLWPTPSFTIAPGDTSYLPVEFVARQVGLGGLNTEIATISSNADVDAAGYDNDSQWSGIGQQALLTVVKETYQTCVGNEIIITFQIENAGSVPVTIDNLRFVNDDLNGDGTPDVVITSVTSGIVIDTASGSNVATVYVKFNPSGKFDSQDLAILFVTNPDMVISDIPNINSALNLRAIENTGFTNSDLVGATKVGTAVAPIDQEYRVSIGDEFQYEINTSTNSNISVDANVKEITVEIDYNQFFVTPRVENVSDVQVLKAGVIVDPASYKDSLKVGGERGERTIQFKLVANGQNDYVLGTTGSLISIPFLAVLPADNETYNPDEILDTDPGKLGIFEMSHRITINNEGSCYSNISNRINLGINEICTGTFRVLYIGSETNPSIIKPNPMTKGGGVIEYSVPFDQPGEIELYNSTMQRVAVLHDGEMKEGRQSVEVPVGSLPNGSYYFKITMGKNQEVGRLVIQK